MASFAERMGHRAVRSVTQSEALDDETRIELWNLTHALRQVLDEQYRRWSSVVGDQVVSAIWKWSLKQPADMQPTDGHVWGEVKSRILKGQWFDALDLIEDIVGYVARFDDDDSSDGTARTLTDAYNNCFEQYLVGYRFIGKEITPVDSTAESEAVATAIDEAKSIRGARHALGRAVELLADRQSPDYPNSIKESISAVESVCVAITGEQTLGGALKNLKSAGVKIHPALEGAWSKMYGWTSDADGIRHGTIDAPDADQALAKYMLVTCSAFVSHVIEVSRKAGLLK